MSIMYKYNEYKCTLFTLNPIAFKLFRCKRERIFAANSFQIYSRRETIISLSLFRSHLILSLFFYSCLIQFSFD